MRTKRGILQYLLATSHIKQATIAFVLIILPITSWAEKIGKVILVQGHPMVERDDQHLLLKRNDSLFTDDTVITPIGSKILFRLEDNSTISLAENTQFKLTEYTYKEGNTESTARFDMLKGAFRTLTGKMGTEKSPTFEIRTPVATIGVRGTEFWGGFIFSDALDVTMLEGKGVYIKNEFGIVELTTPGEGTLVHKDSSPSAVTMWSKKKLKAAVEATSLKQPSNSSVFDSSNY